MADESTSPAWRPLSRTAALAGGAEPTLYHRMAEGSGRGTADGIDDKELLGFEVEAFK